MKNEPGPPLSNLRAAVLTQLELFFLALGFLTRLGPVRVVSPATLARSLFYFPQVGAVLGLIIAAPIYLGLLAGRPLVAALLITALHAWLTRGLHHDGIADFFDALGSGKSGDDFWKVMKDSRLGAFGGLALVFTVLAHVILIADCLNADAILPIIFFPIFGRCLPAVLIYLTENDDEAKGLGAIFSSLERKSLCAGTALLALAALGLIFVGWAALLAAIVPTAAFTFFLLRLGHREGRINGDIMGALIIIGELCLLAGVAVTSIP